MAEDVTLEVRDLDSNSPAVIALRRAEGAIALGFGIQTNGDLDLVLSDTDARRFAEAILAAIGTP